MGISLLEAIQIEFYKRTTENLIKMSESKDAKTGLSILIDTSNTIREMVNDIYKRAKEDFEKTQQEREDLANMTPEGHC